MAEDPLVEVTAQAAFTWRTGIEAGEADAVEEAAAHVVSEVRAILVRRLEAEVRPLLAVKGWDGGYDCCGCSTYDAILDHAIRIIRGTTEEETDG